MRNRSPEQSEPPPFLGRWNNVYILIVAVLAIVSILFYIFTKHYE